MRQGYFYAFGASILQTVLVRFQTIFNLGRQAAISRTGQAFVITLFILIMVNTDYGLNMVIM